MTAMNFYMPTKVYQEWNAVANHAEEIASFGKKALIVTGRHSSCLLYTSDAADE